MRYPGAASASSTAANRQQPQVAYSMPAASSSSSPRHGGAPSASFRAEESRYYYSFLNYPASRSSSPSLGGPNSKYSPSLPIFPKLDGSTETAFRNASRIFAQIGIHGGLASPGRNPAELPFIGEIYKTSPADKSALSYATGGPQSSPQSSPPSPAFERHFYARDADRFSPTGSLSAPGSRRPPPRLPKPAPKKGATKSKSPDSDRTAKSIATLSKSRATNWRVLKEIRNPHCCIGRRS
jgi:hypothetical protein